MTNRLMLGAAALAFFLVVLSGLSQAADAQKGKALVARHCTACHGSEVYTRPGRKIGSLDALRRQVNICSENARTGWNESQKADVVAFLNEAYYHFKQ